MRYVLQRFALVLVAALFAGCGALTSPNGSSPPAPTPTGNATGATSSGTSIVIATDHAAYAPTDSIRITITNHLSSAIWAYDQQASCTIVNLQQQVNGVWQNVTGNVAGCPLGSLTIPVAIQPGATYQGGVRAGYLRQGDAGFALGTYRLVLDYYTSRPVLASGTPGTAVYSASLTVAANIPPEPTPTNPATTPGAGSGTALPVSTSQSHP